MKNRLLYLGGAVVALLLLGLVVAVRSGGGKASPAPSVGAALPDGAPAVVSPAPPPAAAADAAPAAATTTAPGPVAPAPPPSTDGEPPRIVHDHSGEVPAAGSPLTPDTVFTLRQSIAPLVKTCAEPLVRAGQSGSFTLVAKFSIVGGKVAASPTSVSHKEFKDEAFDACVQKAVAELAVSAPAGQIDTSYRLAMPFKFP